MATTTKTARGPVLAAVYTALNVAAITTTLGCGVYDNDADTQQVAFPFLRISTPSGVPWDTFGAAGKERTVQVSVFSQYRGGIQSQNILDKVVQLLQDVAHSVSGHVLAGFRLEQDGEGADEVIAGVKTTHKWVQFRVHVVES